MNFHENIYESIEVLKKSKNLIYMKEADGYIHPCPDWEHPEDFSFYYFKPLNKEGMLELNTFLSLSEEKNQQLTLLDINKVISLEIDEWDSRYIYLYRMEDINKKLIEDYKKIGFKVIIQEEE